METKLSYKAEGDIKLLHAIKWCEGEFITQYSRLDLVAVT
jgi:hypothetical protein